MRWVVFHIRSCQALPRAQWNCRFPSSPMQLSGASSSHNFERQLFIRPFQQTATATPFCNVAIRAAWAQTRGMKPYRNHHFNRLLGTLSGCSKAVYRRLSQGKRLEYKLHKKEQKTQEFLRTILVFQQVCSVCSIFKSMLVCIRSLHICSLHVHVQSIDVGFWVLPLSSR